MSHTWVRGILCPERIVERAGKEIVIPEVPWFPHCSTCGAQIAQAGRGNKAKHYYRASSYHEWSVVEVPCVQKTFKHHLDPSHRHPKGYWWLEEECSCP